MKMHKHKVDEASSAHFSANEMLVSLRDGPYTMPNEVLLLSIQIPINWLVQLGSLLLLLVFFCILQKGQQFCSRFSLRDLTRLLKRRRV